MARDKIEVRMGEGVVARAPHIISSPGLGSCVVVTLYDAERRMGGLAHIMLPASAAANGDRNVYKGADTALAALLEGLSREGAARWGMVAKMAGGAQMFSNSRSRGEGIGRQNIESIKRILKRERIRLVAEDTGGHHGRSVEFDLNSGVLTVQAIGREDTEV